MQKSSSRRSSTRFIGPAIVAKLMVAGCFVGGASAGDREATVAVLDEALEILPESQVLIEMKGQVPAE